MQTTPVQIMIVDDDPSILSLLEEVFRFEEGVVVSAFSDSRQAYDELTSESFDLLITDLMMPEVDGLNLLEHARSVHPEILVVIVTGYASLETTLQAIHAGVYDYITKPFRLEEFRLLVHNAAARIRLMQELKHLRHEKQEMQLRLDILTKRCKNQQVEMQDLREDIESQQAGKGWGLGENEQGKACSPRSISSYQKMSETSEERYEREIRQLEDLFSSGRLASEEFERARQNLKMRTQS